MLLHVITVFVFRRRANKRFFLALRAPESGSYYIFIVRHFLPARSNKNLVCFIFACGMFYNINFYDRLRCLQTARTRDSLLDAIAPPCGLLKARQRDHSRHFFLSLSSLLCCCTRFFCAPARVCKSV